MMRVFWEEWRGAGKFSSVRVLPPLALGTALALLVTEFHPGAFFMALTVGALVGGALSGTQRWNQLLARDWVGLEGVSPLGYVAGKVSGLVMVEAVWVLFLAPPLVLLTLVWGLPWEVSAGALGWVLVGALGAQVIGHLVTWGPSEFQRILGAIFVFLWVAATLQMPGTQRYNPLWQVWRLFHDPGAPFDGGAWLALAGATLAGWAMVALVLGRRENR